MDLSRATLEGWLAWRGRQALDAAGRPLGRIVDIYLDERIGQPTWALVELDDRSAFAPLRGAAPAGSALRLRADAAAVRKAPAAPAGRALSAPTEAMLRRHYDELGLGDVWEAPRPAAEGLPPAIPPAIPPRMALPVAGARAPRRRPPLTGRGATIGAAVLLALVIGVLLAMADPDAHPGGGHVAGGGGNPARGAAGDGGVPGRPGPPVATRSAGMLVAGRSSGLSGADGERDAPTSRGVRGGSFETGFDGWTAGSGGTLERIAAGRDSWALIARAATGGRGDGTVGMVRREVLRGASRGTRVRASAWVRVTEPGANVDLRLVETRAGRQVAVDARIVTVTDRAWRRVTVVGVLDAASSDLDLRAVASGGGDLLLDSVWLEVSLPGAPSGR